MYRLFLFLFVVACFLPIFAQSEMYLADKKYRQTIFAKIDSLLVAKYVYPDKARQTAEQFRERYRSGVYDSYADAKAFAEKITVDLREMTLDKHITFRVIESSDIGEKAQGSLHHSVRYNRLRNKEHAGFRKLEWFEDGGIGYLELRRFNSLDEAQELLNAAMVFLNDANAIIIDIRENGGGSGDYLSNYFLPHPTPLTGAYYREEDYLQEFWTSRAVEKQRMLEVPLFVLTSNRTFSAAEYFAYDMQVHKRATLVGATTKGGAHGVGYFKIDDQFELYLSVETAVNPITGTNWEGQGVMPDVRTPDSTALDTALVLAKKAAAVFGQARNEKFKAAVDEMQAAMDQAEALYRQKKTSTADSALDRVFKIGRPFGLITEFFIYVLASNFLVEKDEPVLLGLSRKRIELFPNSSQAYEDMGYLYYRKRDYTQALPYYSKAVELNPDNRNAEKMIDLIKTKQ